MTLNSLILSTLNGIQATVSGRTFPVPVSFMVYTGTEPIYINFMQYNEQGVLFADDTELKARHSVQISIYSKGNASSVIDEVQERMTAAGFRRNNVYDIYESDTKTFHKVIRYFYSP